MNDFLDSVPKAVGLFSVSVLVLSVFHEAGFYYAVGGGFGRLVSTADYLSGAVAWIPETIYVCFVAIVVALVVNQSKYNFAFKYPGEAIPEAISEKIMFWMYASTLILAVVATFIGPPSAFVDTQFALVWVVFYVWIATAAYLIRKISFIESLPRTARVMLAVVPILITNSWIAGVAEAYRVFFRLQPVFTIMSGDDERHVNLLRSFDKGVLVRDPVRASVELIRWDKIAKLSTPSTPRNRSLICVFTGYTCDVPDLP